MAEKITFDVRKCKRLNLIDPLSVYIRTLNIKLRSDKEIEGLIGNVSAGGAMIVSPIFIPRGATIEIEISAFDSLSTPLKTNSRVIHHEKPRALLPTPLPLKINSKVVHHEKPRTSLPPPLPLATISSVVHTQAKIVSSKRDKDEHIYYMGVEFLDMSDETRSIINEWIEKIHLENTASQDAGE